MKIFYGNGLRGTLAATDKCLFCTEFTECDKTQYEYSLTSTKIDDDGRWCGKVFFRLPASLFHSDRIFLRTIENPTNPPKLGVTAHSLSRGQLHHDGYYNEFISNVLFNTDNRSINKKIEAKCKNILDKVAFVDIDMTDHDAIMVEITADRSLIGTLSSLGVYKQ